MILQNFVFPKKDVCGKVSLYFRKEQGSVSAARAGLRIEECSRISFCSYFNGFSLTKWRGYTEISDYWMRLTVSGRGKAQLRHAVCRDGRICDGLLLEQDFQTEPDVCTELEFPFPKAVKEGFLYAQIQSESAVSLYSGCFGTAQEPAAEVRIAVGICTYHREDYVMRTLALLRGAFLENKSSALYGNIKVYISDNGGTLDPFSSPYISCVQNKNAGGSGGFARCMMEALDEWEKYRFTHFLFMDDDIVMEPETLYRTYMLLAAGVRYSNAAIGGALLRSDCREMQHARGENWNLGKITSPGAGLDLSRKRDLLLNEQDVPVEYNGWWYCCVPFGNNDRNNLPLPLFIHGDDIEYGLRRGGKLLYLNGIGVWHDAFENRRASCMEYYDIRNMLIIAAASGKKVSRKQLERRIFCHMAGQFLKYRYLDMDLTVRAVKDFCRGAGYLKHREPEGLHREILSMGYQGGDLSGQLDALKPGWRKEETKKAALYQAQHFRLHHVLFLNGWLLPGCGKKKAFPMGVWAGRLFWYRNVLYYEPETGRGFVCCRKYREALHLLKDMCTVRRLLKNHFEAAAHSYQMHCRELAGWKFWKRYLGLR